MSDLSEVLTVAVAGLASAGVIAAMLASGLAGALDQPNQRSLHTQPIPRSGGLGILLATAIGLTVAAASIPLVIALPLIASVSWLDDQKHLPIAVRFASHFAAAGIVIWNGSFAAWPLWAAIAAVLATVWMTNLFNFMDGANGLAGGMALFGFGTLALGAHAGGADDLAVLAGCIAAGAAGFLVFNFDPARIFMGDVGSIPLGFLAATIGLEGIHRNLWPVWFPLVAFSPFIADATVTLLRRALRGDKVWQAHREHYYQRLVRMGWSHRRMALAEYALMFAMAALALYLRSAPATVQVAGLVAAAGAQLSLTLLIDRRWRREQANSAMSSWERR